MKKGEKKLILFTDSGDTIIDESTQVFDERGIVENADFIPGAGDVLGKLSDAGFRIALVADGEWESFQNVYRKNGMGRCFEEWIVSEVVGEQKPSVKMFDTAMDQMRLKDEDKPFIVMIGNNLKKDIAGANRFGITSIWLDWSPRYFHEIEEPDWEPDYTVKTPDELYDLICKLEEKAEKQAPLYDEIDRKIDLLSSAFKGILYETDDKFLENMKEHNLAGDDINRYKFWEWTQGVGLFGLWKLYGNRGKEEYLDILKEYYDRQLEVGFPALNVNTVTPYLAMSYLAEYTGEKKYMEPCVAAAHEIMEHFPRTEEGGFQHKTSDSLNDQELWDDTLYMTVLFLTNMARILKDEAMMKEAEHQFVLHKKYLMDEKTGLWYHGFTFLGHHNFAGAFWGRGNSWITMVIPEFLSIREKQDELTAMLVKTLNRQIDALSSYQEGNGMWHTLVDDPTSYEEASATCGFAYGITKGIRDGIVPREKKNMADLAMKAILGHIDENGVVGQVSYGTPMGRETKQFYKDIPLKSMPYGQAMAMLFLMEYRMMKFL
jgi:unsaturated rhamnogalacturonyl hydrolase